MTAQILVVEDEPVIALDIRQRLVQLGYSVTAIADCAFAALQAVRQRVPDLILMDIHLRDQTNGIQAAAQIREQYNLPIIFLTAHTDSDTIQQVKATQPFAYIVKPFETHDLSTSIEIALSRFRAETAVQVALKREQELNQLKSQFVAIVSHEFRNPLNSILFSLELLEDYGDRVTASQKQAYFRRAKNCVQRMNELLEEVLVVSETEAGKLECQVAPLNLSQFCQEMLEEFQATLTRSKQICYSVTGEPNAEYLLDRKLLSHILSNLLSNAIKYSPETSEIYLRLDYQPDTVHLSIIDQGIGIPLEDQAQLFTCFHRGTNVGTIPGTGLGLAIVKQCVDSHGGTIDVTSEPGQGTTFTASLPLRSALERS